MIGFLRVLLVAVPATIIYGMRVIWPAFWKSAKLPSRCESVPRDWSRILLWASGTKVVLENVEVIDPERPQILVANHSSWFDVPALAGNLPRPYRFVAKKELAKVPFFGPTWVKCGHISIDRDDSRRAVEALAEARRRLEEGCPTIVLFPEGTRSDTGELRRFKKGAFVLAIQTGVEVVPAAVIGSREIMPKGSWRIRTGRTIRVRFGEPLSVEGMDLEDRNVLTKRARDAVAALQSSTT